MRIRKTDSAESQHHTKTPRHAPKPCHYFGAGGMGVTRGGRKDAEVVADPGRRYLTQNRSSIPRSLGRTEVVLSWGCMQKRPDATRALEQSTFADMPSSNQVAPEIRFSNSRNCPPCECDAWIPRVILFRDVVGLITTLPLPRHSRPSSRLIVACCGNVRHTDARLFPGQEIGGPPLRDMGGHCLVHHRRRHHRQFRPSREAELNS